MVKGHAFDGIKILGDGALSKNLEIHATKFSESATSKIAAAGGKTVVVAYRPHAVHARTPKPDDQTAAAVKLELNQARPVQIRSDQIRSEWPLSDRRVVSVLVPHRRTWHWK